MDIHALYEELTQEQKREFIARVTLEFNNNLNVKLQKPKTHCPHCKSNEITSRGSCRGTKRYSCKECNKSFSSKTETAFHYTKKPLETWKKYIDLMFSSQMPLRKIAKLTGISLPTAFYWRHKVLNALNEMQSEKLNGVVETDETLFPLSYKGKKRDMPRKPRKRGGIKGAGVTKDHVCVLAAIDRTKTKNKLLQSVCLGRPTTQQITDTLKPQIASDAILITDKHRSYLGFARDMKLKHYALRSKKFEDRSIHLQNINSLHSQVKRFMRPFNGVATKYLDHYLTYYKWSGQDADETAAVLAQSTASVTCAHLTAMQMRLK